MTWPFSPEVTAVLASTVTAILLKAADAIFNRSSARRSVRKDLREEVAELWARIDAQDVRLAEKDSEITKLKGDVFALTYYKERYQAAALENEELRKQIRQMEALQTRVGEQQRHIESLEHEIAKLKAKGE